MKTFIAILAVLVVLGLGSYYWFGVRGAAAVTETAPQTAKVERRPMKISIASTGRIVSNLDVDVKCKASGKVIKLPKDVSDTISVDDKEPICEIDPVDMQPIVSQAQASLNSSKAKYDQAQRNYDVAKLNLETTRMKADANVESAQAHLMDARNKAGRTKDLTETKPAMASLEELETANTAAAQAAAEFDLAKADRAELDQQKLMLDVKFKDIDVAKAQVDKDQSNLDDANQRMADTKIYAPMDGVVVSRTVNVGALIQSGTGTVSGGTTIMTISDLSHLWVYATVDESDIGTVAIDQPVEVTADAYPNVEFSGVVRRIATKGLNSSNVVTFEVRIEVTSKNKRLLKPEMTANVKIITMDEAMVTQVPVQAVVRQRESRRKGPATTAAAAASTEANDAATMSAEALRAGSSTREGRGGEIRGADTRSVDAILRRPTPGTALVVKADGTQETRQVTVGRTDSTVYEVLSGLEEGETVVLQAGGDDSKWKGNGARPMGMPGGGGGRGR